MSNKDKIKLSLEKLEKVLKTLDIAVHKPMDADKMNIDGTIQRFEFCVELYWLLLKNILNYEGIIVSFPKEVLISSYSNNLIDDEDIWLQMLDNRNKTSHSYNEDLADEIYGNIKKYLPVMQGNFMKLKEKYR